MRTGKHMKRLLATALLLALALACAAPGARAQEEQKIVRVGWFDSTFCYWDQFGRRCGLDYEYQQKISAYTGWTYEYVEDSWPNLLQKLMAGEIDLLSDVSYKAEREEFISYPDLLMGTESYYIYIDAKNRDITADNLASFNGKRIGVNQGSIQEGFLKDWAERNGVSLEIVPLTTEEDVSMTMVLAGTIDGYASVHTFSAEHHVTPVVRVGASDYFYGVNKNRPDLLAELNMALSGIRDEDPYFNERLSEERLYTTQTNVFLTPTQEGWIKEHGVIRVGYLDNNLPFCQADKSTGALTGALRDFLTHAENNLNSSDLHFEAVPYATTAAALEALKAGEIDCVFPVCLSDYDADQMGVRLTSPAMKTGVNTVLRESDDRTLTRDSTLSIAVVTGNPNAETFIMDQFPGCRRLTFPNETACYEAVASGTADSTLVSNYRLPFEEETITKYKLYSVPTGEHIPYSFAVRRADRDLYFLLNKAVIILQSGEMDSALASYMRVQQKVSFTDFLRDHWVAVLIAISVVFILIVFLLLQRLKAQRKAHEQERLLEEAAEIAELKQTISSVLDNMPGMTFTKDANTGVYLACNQAFADYAHRENPESIIGRTDAELFDPERVKHILEDDKMTLSMDGPYIYFEDVPDDDGGVRQIRTTKLKYTDAAGRLCILGMRQDVTDTVRIQRQSVTSRESYEKARSTGIIHTHIAQALARGYSDLYYIDLNTEQFIEYRIDEKSGSLTEARRGWHFFEQCQEETESFVHPDDQEAVKKALDRKTLIAALDQNNTFMMTYRLNEESGPVYVNMKVTRMQDDDRFIVMGVMDIDEEVKQRTAAMRMREEQIAYNRLRALAGDFLCIYVVVPETGRYREFSSKETYTASFVQAREGLDFFKATRDAARVFTHPEDLNRFLTVFTRENMLAEIERNGMFTISYRLMMEGVPRYVQLKASMVEEKEGKRLIVGINDIDTQVRQEETYVNRLAQARLQANIDPLTGIKNKNAWKLAEDRLNEQIAQGQASEFAVVLLDVNDLKKINDTDGHSAGDQYLRDACKIICNTFKHSPVFRMGGDEFAAIAQGEDYARIDELILQMSRHNAEAQRTGGIVIACGMAKRENDDTVAPVLQRADQKMYENKNELKHRESANRP